MSMLSTQVDNLRLTADLISEHGVTSGDLAIVETRLREAADTIEKLEPHSNQLEPSRYSELFGTPERAARTLECSCHLLYGLKVDGFTACVGCPVFDKHADVDDCCYDALLEWLEGDV